MIIGYRRLLQIDFYLVHPNLFSITIPLSLSINKGVEVNEFHIQNLTKENKNIWRI